jgi:hypothetical protein
VSDDERSVREISNLVYRFGYLLDKADFDGIGELLAHATFGSDLLGRAAFRGKEEIAQQFRRTSPPEGVKRTKQFYSNMIVDLDGEKATAMCNFLVLQATETLPLQPIVCGHFEDSFERVDGVWRFTERYNVVELVGNMSERLYEGTLPER